VWSVRRAWLVLKSNPPKASQTGTPDKNGKIRHFLILVKMGGFKRKISLFGTLIPQFTALEAEIGAGKLQAPFSLASNLTFIPSPQKP
jgi:hypothetical protein